MLLTIFNNENWFLAEKDGNTTRNTYHIIGLLAFHYQPRALSFHTANMNFTKKIDRAVQWAGEKMGGEAKTNMTDEFKSLEMEMALRAEGMDRLQKSMTAYVKWVGRRGETFEDKEKGLPISYLGRTMASHGEDFEHDSEFGNCLTSLGRANERMASAQERYVADATATWLESLERNLAMIKEYQVRLILPLSSRDLCPPWASLLC